MTAMNGNSEPHWKQKSTFVSAMSSYLFFFKILVNIDNVLADNNKSVISQTGPIINSIPNKMKRE